jgi:hypothetical protein
MRRRDLIKGIAGSTIGWHAARAQIAKVRQIGLLSPFTRSDAAPWNQAFLKGLRDLGWIDGKNIAFEYRYSEGNNDRLPALIADLVRLKVDDAGMERNRGGGERTGNRSSIRRDTQYRRFGKKFRCNRRGAFQRAGDHAQSGIRDQS